MLYRGNLWECFEARRDKVLSKLILAIWHFGFAKIPCRPFFAIHVCCIATTSSKAYICSEGVNTSRSHQIIHQKRRLKVTPTTTPPIGATPWEGCIDAFRSAEQRGITQSAVARRWFLLTRWICGYLVIPIDFTSWTQTIMCENSDREGYFSVCKAIA